MNGRCGSDLNGSFIYISTQGCSLIDCVLCSPDLLPFVLDFNAETRTESKHLPVSAILKKDLLQDIKTPNSGTMNNARDQPITKYDFSDTNRDLYFYFCAHVDICIIVNICCLRMLVCKLVILYCYCIMGRWPQSLLNKVTKVTCHSSGLQLRKH